MPCDSWYAPSTKPDHDPFLLFPQYQYRPLPDGDYIRVLILEPGCGNEPLVCSLKATDLSDTETRIEYEAVSYAWGSGTKDQALLVNNSLCIITRNLRRALEQTRYTDKQRRLWADSICINQHDLAEKGHQVGLMARIYSESSCALICMGSAVAHRAAAIELSGLVSDVNHMMSRVFHDPGFSWDRDSFPRPAPDSPLIQDPRWKSVGRLLSLPWFRRGWVVQEAALGPRATLLWAGTKLDWLELLRFYYWFLFRARVVARQMSGLKPVTGTEMRRLHWRTFEIRQPREGRTLNIHNKGVDFATFELPEALDTARDLVFSDPRDRVYGFLGLRFAEAIKDRITPDYKCSAISLYHRTAVEYIDSTSDLSLLRFVCHDEASLYDDDVSTWVPRWDQRTFISGSFAVSSKIDHEYECHGPCQTGVVFQDHDRVLCCRALVCGRVSFASENCDVRSTKISDIGRLYDRVLKYYEDSSRGCPSDLGEGDTYFGKVVVFALIFIYVLSGGATLADEEQQRAFLLNFTNYLSKDPHEESDVSAWNEHFHRIFETILRHSHGRRFVIYGAQGTCGLAPAITVPGDEVALLPGYMEPIILRNVPQEQLRTSDQWGTCDT